MLKISTFCSGIGSPEVALKNLGIEHEIVLTAEIDKYARETYLANHYTKKMVNDMTKPDYIGEEYYSDLNISGLPCQSFSLAGKRLGELDPRGLLFFDFLRYVKNQNPKYFIIENVKGLLSDNDGETFRNWIQLLGQSENGNTFIFPHEDSLMYNLHWQVLNTKDYGLPQNRERVFLIGIRNDLPNSFVFPKGVPLKLRLKDILEPEVDEKYYLSEKIIKGFQNHSENMKLKGNGFSFKPIENTESEISSALTARYYKMGIDDNYLKVPFATKSGYGSDRLNKTLDKNEIPDEACFIDAYNQTLNTEVTSTVLTRIDTSHLYFLKEENKNQPKIIQKVGDIGTSNCLSTVQKDNLVVYTGIAVHPISKKLEFDGFKDGNSPALLATDYKAPKCVQYSDYRIRKLTPKECFRLQGFPDEFLQNAIDAGVSNSQLYKQAGNTISVPPIQAILKNLLK